MKCMEIEGLAANGLWVLLFEVPLLDDLSQDEAEQAMDKFAHYLKTSKDNISMSNDARAVVFNPSQFLATRIVLKGF